MSEIVKEFSAPVLVTAIEANLFEAIASWGRWPQAELHDAPDTLRFVSGIPHFLLNYVLRAQFAPDDIDTKIDETLTHFKSRKLPMLWWTGPATRPTDLGKHLESHGLTHPLDAAGMAVHLLALNEDFPTLSGLTIQEVRDVDALKQYSHAFTRGFEVPDFVGNGYFDLFASLGFGAHGPWCHYVGLLKGEPVGCSSLFLGAGVAGIYCVATVAEARRQGIGTAVTLAPLRDARAMGYQVGILHSSPMGLGVYRQLGFKEYCKVGWYVWAGETSQYEANDGG